MPRSIKDVYKRQQQVYLNEENVTDRLREEMVGNMASKSSAVAEVREHLLALQRELARTEDVVLSLIHI